MRRAAMEARQTMAALPSSQWRWEVAVTLTWQTDTDVDLLGTVSIETALILDAPKRSAWETPRGPAAVLAMQ